MRRERFYTKAKPPYFSEYGGFLPPLARSAKGGSSSAAIRRPPYLPGYGGSFFISSLYSTEHSELFEYLIHNRRISSGISGLIAKEILLQGDNVIHIDRAVIQAV